MKNEKRTYQQQIFKDPFQRKKSRLLVFVFGIGKSEQIPEAAVGDVDDMGVAVRAEIRQGVASRAIKAFVLILGLGLGAVNRDWIEGKTLRNHFVWNEVQNLRKE
jgi:hypothetical protein